MSIQQLFRETLNLVDNPLATKLAQKIYNSYPEYHYEFNSIANTLKLNILDVVKVNIAYDLAMGVFGCTTIVGKNENNLHWIGRNMDWFSPDLIKKNTVIFENNFYKSVSVYGLIGVVTGINKHFALIVNALPGIMNNSGIPVLFGTRKILESCNSFEEAEEKIKETEWLSSGLLTLVNKNQCSIYELLEKPKKRNLNNYPIVVTNFDENNQNACARYQRAKQLNPKNLIEVKTVLADSQVKQDITAQTIFINFEEDNYSLFFI